MGIQRRDISGNAGTATKLQTARQIGGVSFDGTANITLPGVNAAGNQNTSGNAATATTAAACTGNAATVTNGVYTVGDQTIAGQKTFSGQVNLDGASSRLPSHGFHNEFTGAGDVYEHYYAPGSENVKNSSANLRVASTTGFYKTLRFVGDGSFTWDGANVVTTANIREVEATASAGAVGTYAFAQGVVANPGQTAAGSSLSTSNRVGTWGPTLSGTWRCMGYADVSDRATLWLRIA